jgi:hypothetical protein
MTTITLTDAAGTPVNRSYPLVQASPDLAVWWDLTTNGGYPVLAGRASISVRTNASNVTRVTGKLVLPAPDSVIASEKAFEEIGSFEFVIPGTSSLQRRKDLKAMLRDLMGDALIDSAVESFVHVS